VVDLGIEDVKLGCEEEELSRVREWRWRKRGEKVTFFRLC